MKPLDTLLPIYQQQHTHKINRITHFIGIPCIVFSLLMLFSWISIDIAGRWQISFSWILLVTILIYYFMLNIRLAIAATVTFVIMLLLADWIAGTTPTPVTGLVFAGLFIGGWLLQFIGHAFEKKKPAFFFSKTQLLIGPLFVLVELLEKIGITKYFISPRERQ